MSKQKRESIFKGQSHLTLNKVKNTIKLFDRTLNSRLEPIAAKAFCLGFILSMAMYTDISPKDVSQLNTYVRLRSKV